MEHIPAPQALSFNQQHIADRWKTWKESFELYIGLTMATKSEKEKCTALLYLIGNEGREIYKTFKVDEETRTLANVIEKFDKHCKPKTNITVERYKFNTRDQYENETIEQYVTGLKILVRYCDYGTIEDDLIRDRVVCGLRSQKLKERLLREENLNLDRLVDICKAAEESSKHVKMMTSGEATPISAVKKHKKTDKKSTTSAKSACRCCGLDHKIGKEYCPARKSTCNYCKKTGHWYKVCRNRKSSPNLGSRFMKSRQHNKNDMSRKFHELEIGSTDSESEIDQYDSITIASMSHQKEAFAKVYFEIPEQENTRKRCINFKIDTGAAGNTIPLRILRQIHPDIIDDYTGQPIPSVRSKADHIKLTAYNGTTIKCLGKISMNCRYKKTQWKKQDFYIVDVKTSAIAGIQMCTDMGIVTIHSLGTEECTDNPQVLTVNNVDQLKEHYPDQFDKIGKLPGKAKLLLKENAEPKIDAPRKYSIHIKNKLKQELDSMERDGIIRKVTEHSDWCSSITTVIKPDGSLRVCLDPKHLNNNLKRCPHKTQTLEEITHNFHESKFFSKLDAMKGYWNVELSEESQILTTFRTPHGRYCYRRLPFGLNVSQDIFQQKIDAIIENCEGTIGIHDDIVVYGKTEEEHDKNLVSLMNMAKKNSLVFNSKKCFIKQTQISFFGMIYTQDGVKPDPKKVEDIQAIPTPTSKKELQQFMGAINYLSPFIKNLSSNSEPLRKLLSQQTPFEWSEDYEHVFNELKQLISKDACLRYYDTRAPTYLMVDASIKGLGAAILQPMKTEGRYSQEDLRPVAYASKSLTPGETKLANIEREMLAVRFGIKRFHTYLFNRPFTVLSDHRPLEMISRKPLSSTPPRLQSLFMEIQGYDYKIKYTKGQDVGIADTLSRLPNMTKNESMKPNIQIDTTKFKENRLNELKAESAKDPVINNLKEIIYNGWPENIKDLPKDVRPYWSIRDELTMDDGIVFKGQCILIPETQKQEILRNLHTSHLGIQKTILRAKSDVYWINMYKDIEQTCKNCATCQKYADSQKHENLIQTEIPSRPWKTVGADIFTLHSKDYLIIADYYSKFPIIEELPTPCPSKTVADICRKYFSIFGIPVELRSDNGPHFAGNAFQKFIENWNIIHTTSSPRYPQSNGFIERQIRTVKKTMKKAIECNEDIHLAILRLRTTPINNKINSPSEIMFDRKIKDTLPSKIFYQSNQKEQTYTELSKRQEAQKLYHDKRASDLPPLYAGQKVTVLEPDTHHWSKATVVKSLPEPRSYQVQKGDGTNLRRNRKHIRENNSKTNIKPALTSGSTTRLKKTHRSNREGPTTRLQAESSYSPKQIVKHSVRPQSETIQKQTNATYTTRSGRVVKLPNKYTE